MRERLCDTGPNALRALDEMGLTEAMMAHADQKALDQKPFRFVSGLPGHEHILDVSVYSLSCMFLLVHQLNRSTKPCRKTSVWAYTGLCPALYIRISHMHRMAELHSWTPL